MISKYFISLFALVATVPLSQAVPTTATALDVYAPKWIYPDGNAVWERGSIYIAKWNTSDAPSQITNPTGMIFPVQNNTIDLYHLLAKGFNILDGEVGLEVPADLHPGKYQLVLFGDSGDWSPIFTIV